MEPRQNYGSRNGLGARLGTAPPHLRAQAEWVEGGPSSRRPALPPPQLPPWPHVSPPSGPLLDSPRRGRAWLALALVVLAEIALLTSAYIFVRLAFPQ